jgi:hypothetical protein
MTSLPAVLSLQTFNRRCFCHCSIPVSPPTRPYYRSTLSIGNVEKPRSKDFPRLLYSFIPSSSRGPSSFSINTKYSLSLIIYLYLPSNILYIISRCLVLRSYLSSFVIHLFLIHLLLCMSRNFELTPRIRIVDCMI